MDRLIHGHQRSLALARCERTEPAAPAACESDSTRFRVVVNALRREIDRLESGIVQRHDHGAHRTELNRCERDIVFPTNSSPVIPVHRNSNYGVPALGDVGQSPAGDSCPPQSSDQVESWLRVTNLGTLLDVLA